MTGISRDEGPYAGLSQDTECTDPAFMVHGHPEHVMSVLDSATGSAARLAAAVFRASAHIHHNALAGVRRDLLGLDAARYGDRRLAARIAAVPVDGEPAPWVVRWSTGSRVDPRLWRTITVPSVFSMAAATVEERPCAITGERDGTVRVWDLTTGRRHGPPLKGHTERVEAVATAMVDGRPCAITGSTDGTVRVWDLISGRPRGEPLLGRTRWILAVATTVVDGRACAVAGDGDVARVWDLAGGRQVGEPLTGHNEAIRAVATATVADRPCAITGSYDGMVRIWDLATGRQAGEPLTGHLLGVKSVATALIDDQPV